MGLTMAQKDTYLWPSFWLLVRKAQRVTIHLCRKEPFRAPPFEYGALQPDGTRNDSETSIRDSLNSSAKVPSCTPYATICKVFYLGPVVLWLKISAF